MIAATHIHANTLGWDSHWVTVANNYQYQYSSAAALHTQAEQ